MKTNKAQSFSYKLFQSKTLGLLLLSLLIIFFLPVIDASGAEEQAPLLAPSATVSITGPGNVLLGYDFSFEVRFDNNTSGTTSEIGFGPFIDVYFPADGGDGNGGISFDEVIGATYLGDKLTQVYVQTFPDDDGGTGCAGHPLAVYSHISTQASCAI